ncbi:TAXI family TRAP transporter solute-binding subunit [Paucibacter sp. APW11]|uniref:TAXI family TRAP transporter solute-binding subunit n=1 Tax=Roseateles aquae TaxID=3077235 RepID=A0ABU3PCG0_9BURK|nr:TAXI family TRAP transporter solute-binding subunit [Paucibacter sp. APW11]MDT9000228.1 TAXI family TRAP transporter solute-binding subunit [Paucibacter sp. APW11]
MRTAPAWPWAKGLILCLSGLLVAWLLLSYFFPSPPSRIAIATGFKGGSYEYFGQRYARRLGQDRIKVELRQSSGSVDNISQLNDAKSGVAAAFVQGGVSDAARSPQLVSLGRINYQAFWIFYRGTETLQQLTQLKGKRIAIGPTGSGTEVVARQVLGISGVNEQTAQLLPLAGQQAVDALHDGRADVIFLAFAPEAPVIQALMRDASVKLMDVKPAEALTRIFPFLVKLVLPQGVFDFERNIPAQDITLIGSTNALLVREDMHPELIHLLARTLKAEHGGAGLFQHAGDFPQLSDPEYPMAPAALDYYRNGPSLLQRYLPFWVGHYVQKLLALLMASAALLFPLLNYLPRLLRWMVRERLHKLYRRLRLIDRQLLSPLPASEARELLQALDQIDRESNVLGVPTRHSDLFFSLKTDIHLVRSQLQARLPRSDDAGDEGLPAAGQALKVVA